jgi:hypothetical protein
MGQGLSDPKWVSLSGSAIWLTVLLVTVALVAAYEFAMNLLVLNYAEMAGGTVVETQVDVAPSGALRAAERSDGARLVYRLFRVGALVPLLVWVFRAHRNLAPLEAGAPSGTSWWAVAGGGLIGLGLLGLFLSPWAVPGVLIGLVPLVMVLGETWKGSDPGTSAGRSRDGMYVWSFLTGWVVSLVIVVGVSFSTAVLSNGNSGGSLTHLRAMAHLFRFESLATVVWAALTVIMVLRISGDQEKRAGAIEYERYRAERLQQRQREAGRLETGERLQ